MFSLTALFVFGTFLNLLNKDTRDEDVPEEKKIKEIKTLALIAVC